MKIGPGREVSRGCTRVLLYLLAIPGLVATGPISARETAQPPAATVLAKSPLPGLETYIERAMRDWGVPGLAIAIVKDDKIVYARGFGVRNSETREPVDENTIFATGSITKSFTTTAIAMLVDEGKMSWDTPVKKYLPYFETYDPYVTSALSMRDIACHRTGIEQANYLHWGPNDRADTIYYPTRADIVRAYKYLRPSEGFRTVFAYKNETWVVAGEVIGAVSGTSWDQVLHERIFKPLGMTRSSTSVTETDSQSNVSSIHVLSEGQLRPIKALMSDSASAMGSINSTVMDLAQYARFHLGDGSFGGKPLLSPALFDELHTPQMVDHNAWLTTGTPFAQQTSYSLGWWVQDYRGYKLIRHAGEPPGGSSNILYIPEKHLGVVMLANGDAMSLLAAIGLRTLDGYLGAKPYDWNARAIEQEPERLDKYQNRSYRAQMAKRANFRATGTRPTLSLGDYAGVYHNGAYGDLRISYADGKLTAKLWTHTGDLSHWEYDTFFLKWDPTHYFINVYPERDPFVHFEIDAAGLPTRIKFSSLGIFERVGGHATGH
jgi:CubicO group peptidase (beta-lactamase class C family)